MKITYILPAIGKKTGQKYLKSWLMEPLTIAVLNSMIPDTFEREFFDDRMENIKQRKENTRCILFGKFCIRYGEHSK